MYGYHLPSSAPGRAPRFLRVLLSGATLLLAIGCGTEGAFASGLDDELPQKLWEESELQPPAYPPTARLQPFFVSPLNDNQFFIDPESLTVGLDGVVRYVLVVLSPSGVRNVSYEGLRCSSAEKRLYAFGRQDQTWSKARGKQWVRIENNSLNRHHAVLFAEHFCPVGMIVRSADEARQALRQGGHPATERR